jgi:methylase of polypeptide subunit release factors
MGEDNTRPFYMLSRVRARFLFLLIRRTLMNRMCRSLIALGRILQAREYRFVAVTPATHDRVVRRPASAKSLESVFGWNRPFEREALDPPLFELLEEADVLRAESGLYRSKVRFATIDHLLFVHSGFPTAEQDSVFFGPDTYRFVRLLRASLADLEARKPLRLVDIGAGSGAAGIFAARLLGERTELVLADINRKALVFSAINATLNNLPAAKTIASDVLAGFDGEADLIVANPPYLVDDDRRLYRHGGGELGITLGVRIVEESMAKLSAGGRLILYSGTPIIEWTDPLLKSLEPMLKLYASDFVYEEIDPDVFGDELDKRAYAHAERIAVVGLTVIKRG